MRIVTKKCKKCGAKYGYKASGYRCGEWNKEKGHTGDYCAECAPKTFITPEFHCPPVQNLIFKIRTKIHNWRMRHSARYRKKWRGGREPDKMIECGPATPKPFKPMDLRNLYSMEFDIKDRDVETGED